MEKIAYRMKELQKAVGLSKTTIYHLIQKGEFPQPVKVGKVSVWLRKDIEKWLESLQKPQNNDDKSC